MMAVSIIIPVYNEETGIVKVLKGIVKTMDSTGLRYEVLIVNDGSLDNTNKKILEYKNSMEKDRTDTLRVISHSYNRGYGAGIKTGISNSLFDTVVIIDGDGTYPEDSLPLLLKESHDADMVIGARAGKSKSIPLFHKIAKRVLNILANYLTRCAIKDINSGFRVMDKAIINKFMNILPDGFSFTSTITLAMHINGYKVKYMPISYYKRTGRSKISPVYQVFNFLQLIVRTVMYFDPLRVFLPLSAIFFIVSFIGFMYRAIEGKGLGVFTIMMFIAGMQFLTAGMLADLINKKTR